MKIFPKLLRVPCAYAPLGLVSIALLLSVASSLADYPQWWIDRGVINTNLVATNDYAAANQGQLKHIATKTYDEFSDKLASLDLTTISNLVSGFSTSNNYAAINLGQLKFVTGPFYDVLSANDLTNAWPVGMTSGPYPWTSGSSSANDFALVNLGQLKYVFSFDAEGLGLDSDDDGMPDWWETQYGLNLSTNDASGDADNDGLLNGDEYTYRTDPQDVDSDNDLLIDGKEVQVYLTSPISIDSDNDTLEDAMDVMSSGGLYDSRSPLFLSLAFSPSFHLALAGSSDGSTYEFYFTPTLLGSPAPWVLGDTGFSGVTGGTVHWYNMEVGPGRDLPSAFQNVGIADDSDGDNLSDGFEVVILKTSPDLPDSNDNGINDDLEDFDGDGLSNFQEYLGVTLYGGSSSPWHPDTDGDGICDGPTVPAPYNLVEGPDAFPLDPAGSVDTDGDGMPNELHGTSNSNPPLVEDLDDDGDGLPDVWELQYGLNPTVATGADGAEGDPDRDDLTNLEEYQATSDPLDPNDPIPSPIHYVSPSGSHEYPYLTWATAANDIQAALDAAHDSDTVLVADGTYQISDQISVNNNITLLSVNGAKSTVIEGDGSTRCIYLNNGIVDGFGITGGYLYNANGAGIYILTGTVRNCNIYHNTAAGDLAKGNGAGIYVDVWSFLVENCLIHNNTAANNGGGLAVLVGGSNQDIRNCAIYDNTADWGGGIYSQIYGRSVNTLNVEGTTIARNTATGTGGGGIFLWNDTPYNVPMTVNIRNTISYFNEGATDLNFKTMGSISLNITHSCITPLLAGQGNIADDPALVEGDWHLKSSSPCIDAGANAYVSGSDLDGEPRIVDVVVDIGADEFRDSDGDDIPDWWELLYGLNPDDISDGALNNDGDALTNREEYNNGTNPQVTDTDGDGLSDSEEITGAPPTNPTKRDTDGDGLHDGIEVGLNDSIQANGNGGVLIVVPNEGWYHATDPDLNLVYLGDE